MRAAAYCSILHYAAGTEQASCVYHLTMDIHIVSFHGQTWCMMCAPMTSQVPILASLGAYTSWHPCHDVLICVDYTAVDVRHAPVQHTHVVYDVCTYDVSSADSGVIRHTSWHPCHDVPVCKTWQVSTRSRRGRGVVSTQKFGAVFKNLGQSQTFLGRYQ